MYANETVIELPVSSPAELIAMAQAVPFAEAIRGVARIAAAVYAMRSDGEAQLRLTKQLIGDRRILDRLGTFVRNERPRGFVFAEQNMMVLLRLLIQHARPSTTDTPLTDDEKGILNRALFAATAVTGELSRAARQETERLEDWLPFFIQNGAYNSKEQPMAALARAQELFGRIPSKPEIQASPKACPLDKWMTEDYGVTIEEQLTLGFALMA